MECIGTTIALIQISGKVLELLKIVCDAATTLKSDLAALHQEVENLHDVGESVRNLAEDREETIEKYLPDDELGRFKDIWTRLDQRLQDCTATVKELEDLAEKILRKDGPTIPSRKDAITKLWKKTIHEPQMQVLRQRIRGDQSSLNIHFNSLTPFYARGSAFDVKIHVDEAIRRELHKALAKINALNSPQIEHKLNNIETRLTDMWNLQQQKQMTVYSNKHFPGSATVSPIFTGRQDLLDRLAVDFGLSSPPGTRTQQLRYVIHGMGGSGKTQLAYKFAALNQDHYWGVFLVDASTYDTLESSYKDIARTAGADASVEAALGWLTNLQEPWLLIVDNAELISGPRAAPGTKEQTAAATSKMQKGLEHYLPSGNRGNVLITTRNPSHKTLGNVGTQWVTLDKMPEDDAIELLFKAAGHTYDEEDSEEAAKAEKYAPLIAHNVSYLPLALTHAGKAIHPSVGQCTWESYSDYLKETYKRLPNPHDHTDEEKNVFATFDLIYTDLEHRKQNAHSADTSYADAIDVLSLFSCFHYNEIDTEMLMAVAEGSFVPETMKPSEPRKYMGAKLELRDRVRKILVSGFDQVSDSRVGQLLFSPPNTLPLFLRDQKMHKSRLLDSLSILVKRSLIFQSKRRHVYSMHPLVHQWLLLREMNNGRKALRAEWAVNVLERYIRLGDVLPGSLETTRNKVTRAVLPHLNHLERVQSLFTDAFQTIRDENPSILRPFWLTAPYIGRTEALRWAKFSLVYQDAGQYENACALQQKVHEFVVPRRGMADEISLRVTRLYASGKFHLTLLNDSANLFVDVINASEALYGMNDTATLEAKAQLGFVHCLQGRFSESKQLLTAATRGLDARDAQHGKMDLEVVIRARMNLATTETRYFNYLQSRALLENALQELEEREIESGNSLILDSMAGLCETYANLPDANTHIARSQELIERVVEVRRQTGGKEHPYTLLAQKIMARVYLAAQRYDEGEKLLRETIRIAESTLGVDHFAISDGHLLLARLVCAQGRLTEAEGMYREQKIHLKRVEKRCGYPVEQSSPGYIALMSALVACLEKQNKNEEALATAKEFWSGMGLVGVKDKAYDHPACKRLWVKIRQLEALLREPHEVLRKHDGTVVEFSDDFAQLVVETVVLL
ncbi:hypothetical protein PMZ80_008059 [Knufia obscura]|uniref:AAA+ ATPase domain-containing protein n=2 Tax=Knufia TaxID=430999 RepID=A0AAN8I8C8_9EURO|nr:hypothetical protein PMZ80_008059 [Knufia obscura]KAK5957214.1 hypothetical protein OHC33_001585 [Knufia fluminis]